MTSFHRIVSVLSAAALLALGGCGTAARVAKSLGPRQVCSPLAFHKVPRTAHEAEVIAKRLVGDIMGQPTVLRHEPFIGGLDDDRWIVRSSPHAGTLGPPFLVVIDARTGCPLFIGADG